MIKRNNIIKIAIDSPAAAGAGTVAKALAKHYKLLKVDTGKAYRLIAFYKLQEPKKFNFKFIKNKIKNLKISQLQNKLLSTEEIGSIASEISKQIKIRRLVYKFQIKCAYNPPKKFHGSCLDGRDITTKIMPKAMFKFFIYADLKIRAKRRYLELKKISSKASFNKVRKSIELRDKSDYQRKHSPLKRTKDQVLINSSKLSKKACFLKIKRIMDKKIN